jgi:hypothetical protein
MIDLSTYTPKTTPWDHQRTALELSADRPYFALHMEQRTGKTKVIVDTVAIQYRAHRINALVIMASPNGVHRNWVTDEIPAHIPDNISWRGLVWRSGWYKRREYAQQMEELLRFRGLAVLAINAEAVNTQALRRYVKRLFDCRRVFLVADETSDWMLRPGNKRAMVAYNMSKHRSVIFKRILDGTPVGNGGPFDLYAPMNFLSRSILGFSTFLAYKHHFAVIEDKDEDGVPLTNYKTNATYYVVKEYRNLDELTAKIAPHSFRITRAECFDMPAKVYQKRYFQLDEEQRRIYDQLRDEYEAELTGGGRVIVTNVLTRYLRLQQVASGYWPPSQTVTICRNCKGEANGCEACDYLGVTMADVPLRRIGAFNPRLHALAAEIRATPGPIIVWARFQQDVTDVMGLMDSLGRVAVRFDGAVRFDERDAGLANFQAGTADTLVGSPAAGGRGRRMDAADHPDVTAPRTIIYYSNYFSLLLRLQSEDRAEHPDRVGGTSIIDLVAEGTVDERIITALRARRFVAEEIIDARREGRPWI